MRSAPLTAILLFPALLMSGLAMARPEIALEMQAQKEITVLEDGKEVTRRVGADTIEPGEVIYYTLTYRNSGDEAASDVVINNPVPTDTTYESGSAAGENSKITFSIDGGKTFKAPDQLTYQVKVNDKWEERKATVDRYTHIRWLINRIDAGGSGEINYAVRTK